MRGKKTCSKAIDIIFDLMVLTGALVILVTMGGTAIIILGLLALGCAIDPKMLGRK